MTLLRPGTWKIINLRKKFITNSFPTGFFLVTGSIRNIAFCYSAWSPLWNWNCRDITKTDWSSFIPPMSNEIPYQRTSIWQLAFWMYISHATARAWCAFLWLFFINQKLNLRAQNPNCTSNQRNKTKIPTSPPVSFTDVYLRLIFLLYDSIHKYALTAWFHKLINLL